MAASENNKKDFLEKPLVTMIITSLIHLMPAIVHAHVSTRATSLMHVKNNMPHFFYETYFPEHLNEENEKTKTSN